MKMVSEWSSVTKNLLYPANNLRVFSDSNGNEIKRSEQHFKARIYGIE